MVLSSLKKSLFAKIVLQISPSFDVKSVLFSGYTHWNFEILLRKFNIFKLYFHSIYPFYLKQQSSILDNSRFNWFWLEFTRLDVFRLVSAYKDLLENLYWNQIELYAKHSFFCLNMTNFISKTTHPFWKFTIQVEK